MNNWDDFLSAPSKPAQPAMMGGFGQFSAPAQPQQPNRPMPSPQPNYGAAADIMSMFNQPSPPISQLSRVPNAPIQPTAMPLAATPTSPSTATATPQMGLDAFTPGERNYYATFYRMADVDGDDKISSEEAVTFFRKSGLETPMLSQVWRACNPTGKRVLDRPEFFMAMRLIAAAQQKRPFEAELTRRGYDVQYPPPKFEGLDQYGPTFTLTAATAAQSGPTQYIQPQPINPAPIQPQPKPIPQNIPIPAAVNQPVFQHVSDANDVPPLTAEDVAKYDGYFDRVDTDKDGEIFGQVAKDFFVMSKLDQPILSKIWRLADLNQDMKLNRREFILAMGLVTHCRKGNQLPLSLSQAYIASSQKAPAQSNLTNMAPAIQPTTAPGFANQAISYAPPTLTPMAPPTAFKPALALDHEDTYMPLNVDLGKSYGLFSYEDTPAPAQTPADNGLYFGPPVGIHQNPPQQNAVPQASTPGDGWATFGATNTFGDFGSPAVQEVQPTAFVPTSGPNVASNKVYADGKFTLPTATFEQRATLDAELALALAIRKKR
eukprot:TRINITY_DN3295_c0_g2_i2.p1 TRINITY_DN3295_c0_g2~~TRINITY_DN3295_c0_g2_i2.p1  ORF type:complete len:546 (-),score=104.70 TRINITY_DN3295_c0_g2_i2:169-1806(-)